MNYYEELLAELDKEHGTLHFTEFTSETALAIGLYLAERAKREKKIITIDIVLHGRQIFHYALDGTTPDNDEWIKRKNRVVNRFCKSSYYIGIILKHKSLTLEERYSIDSSEYSAHGGAFPITIKNVGTVGTITVSGMRQEDDHQWVVDAIKAHLLPR